MTHRIDLSPELEAKLQALAAQRGADADATALQVLAAGLETVPVQEPQLTKHEVRLRQREAAVAGYGKMAGLGGMVDDLLRERHEEARREMEAERQSAERRAAREAAA